MLQKVLMNNGLSYREAEVAGLVVKGLCNKDVGAQLFVTEKTIKFHLTNIYQKMKVKSRTQLMAWCAPHMTFEEKVTLQENKPDVVLPLIDPNGLPPGSVLT